MFYRALKPLVFKVDPERAHRISVRALGMAGNVPPTRWLLRSLYGQAPRPVTCFGLTFRNAVGIAAGYDKDAEAWRGLEALGFGHVELGTVTPAPQPGNDKPRVFRVPEAQAAINRLGFPSAGMEVVANRLKSARQALGRRQCVLGVNIGKQKSTPLESAADDYHELILRFAPLSDYLAVNISSPNTPGLRRLQNRDTLEALLRRVAAARSQAATGGRRVPILVKLSPDLEDAALDQAVGVVEDAGLDGIIATNTTTVREGLDPRWDAVAGGLSGAPLTQRATDVVRAIRARTRLPIVGVGGIMSVDDALARIDAGADLLQLYTGLIYAGPKLPGGIVRRL